MGYADENGVSFSASPTDTSENQHCLRDWERVAYVYGVIIHAGNVGKLKQ
jgi:hypothetical protein